MTTERREFGMTAGELHAGCDNHWNEYVLQRISVLPVAWEPTYFYIPSASSTITRLTQAVWWDSRCSLGVSTLPVPT
jgi:hypothetical protein